MEPSSVWCYNRLRTSSDKSPIFEAISVWILGSIYMWLKLQSKILRNYEVCSDSRFDRSASGGTFLH